MNFTALPKVELHLHLEGAAPPALIRQMAHEKRIDLSGIFAADGSYVFRDFTHFLSVYDTACQVLRAPQDFYRLVQAVLTQSAAQGVVYTEVFVSPDFCGGGDLAAWRDYLAAMEEAAATVPGITLRAIVTAIRHLGPQQSRQAALCAAETKSAFLTGFGLAGAEMMHRPADFAYGFDMAREAGLALTCHAGEWGGPDMVRETLDHLRVARIGHGIGAAQDADLVRRLAQEGIMLEVCPGSNVVLGAVAGWAQHPIARLRQAGVPVSISTDDPPFFHTTMTAEYENLARHFGWSAADFRAINQAALAAAFCDDETRAEVCKQLEATP